MYSLEICQLVVVCVDACAEEEAGVAAIYDLGHVTELDEVGLVFLVAWRYEAVDLVRWSANRLGCRMARDRGAKGKCIAVGGVGIGR